LNTVVNTAQHSCYCSSTQLLLQLNTVVIVAQNCYYSSTQLLLQLNTVVIVAQHSCYWHLLLVDMTHRVCTQCQTWTYLGRFTGSAQPQMNYLLFKKWGNNKPGLHSLDERIQHLMV